MTKQVQLPAPANYLPATKGTLAIDSAAVDAVIDAMEPRGLYPVADLHAAYTDLVRSEGREPGNRQAFGQALRRSGRVESRRTETVRYWTRLEA